MYTKDNKEYPFDMYGSGAELKKNLIDYIVAHLGRSRFYFKGGGRETKDLKDLPLYQLLGIAESAFDAKQKQKKKKQVKEVIEIHVYHHMVNEDVIDEEQIEMDLPMTEEERREAIAECYRRLR